MIELVLVAPLVGLAAGLTVLTRRNQQRRSRQEAAWRDMIRKTWLVDR